LLKCNFPPLCDASVPPPRSLSDVARTLTGESLRDFGCRLAESGLLQWSCKLDRLGMEVRIPGKSALQRYSQWLPEAEMRR